MRIPVRFSLVPSPSLSRFVCHRFAVQREGQGARRRRRRRRRRRGSTERAGMPHAVASGKVPPVSFCFILLWLTSYFAGCFSFHRYISRLLKQECRMFCTTPCLSSIFFLFHKKRQDRLVAQLAMQNLLLPCSVNIYLKHLYQEFLKNTFVKS